jgi:hypothetical protein
LISVYDAFIPTARRALTSLNAILGKAEAHCEATGFDPAAFLAARLYPDMFPLTRQIQSAADAAKLGGFRLAGVEAPKHADTETTFPELRARLTSVIDLLGTLTPAQFEGAETRDVVIKTRVASLNFKGLAYMQDMALPNLFFHITTAYALLRHNGVVIGKRDYLGPVPA